MKNTSLTHLLPEVLIGNKCNPTLFRELMSNRGENWIYFSISIAAMIWLFTISSCKKDEVTPIVDTVIKDIDGNVYTSVQIGSQVWMVENLKVTKYNNGDPIPKIGPMDNSWGTLTSGAYSNDYEETNINGRLYNWYAVNDPRKIAPAGWHIPTKGEWTTLVDFLGGENLAGSKMKEKGTAHWCAPNTDATNESGFTGLPGDWRLEIGFATGCGDESWWTADENDAQEAFNLFIFDSSGEVSLVSNKKFVGWGVRCIKD